MSQNPQDLLRWWSQKIDASGHALDQAAQEFTRVGTETMRKYIEDRGTAYSVYRASVLGRGTTGRHDTGNMVNSVGDKIEKFSPAHVKASFGWLDKQDQYFAFQELGFSVYSVSFEGMYALSDSAEEAKERALGRLKQEMRAV